LRTIIRAREVYCNALYHPMSSVRRRGVTVSFTVAVSRVVMEMLLASMTLKRRGIRLPSRRMAVTRMFLFFWLWRTTVAESVLRRISLTKFLGSAFFVVVLDENFLLTFLRNGTWL